MIDDLPPHHIEAEAAVLGALLLEPDAIPLAAQRLRADDFYRSSHRVIFEAICETYGSHHQTDELLLREYLKRKNLLEEVGGSEYIHELTASVPSAANMERYAGIVRDKALARRLIQACTVALRDAETSDPHEVLANAISRFEAITEADLGCEPITIGEALRRGDDRKHSVAHPTGLTDLNEAMNGGYHPGGITLIGGDAKAGKTILALQAIRTAMKYGTPTFVVSRDQRWEHLADRIWSAQSGVPRLQLRSSAEAAETRKLLEESPLWGHQGRFDKTAVCAAIKIMVARYKVQMWVLDYLQRISCPEAERITYAPVAVANALADVAQDTNTHGIVISRVTKPAPGMATQHRFAGEAGVQNAADTMLFVHKLGDTEQKGGPRLIQVIGGRHCGDGAVLAVMEGHLDRYRAAAPAEKDEWRGKLKGSGHA